MVILFLIGVDMGKLINMDGPSLNWGSQESAPLLSTELWNIYMKKIISVIKNCGHYVSELWISLNFNNPLKYLLIHLFLSFKIQLNLYLTKSEGANIYWLLLKHEYNNTISK